MDKKQAEKIAGTLSSPSKMPCHGYSIPATRCITGAKLHEIEGSTCAGCYALKGNYRFSNVKSALEKRFRSLKNPKWVDALTTLILATNNPFFRWHDSGDIQSIEHLKRIVEVCKRTPQVKHWLPTREYKLVMDYLKSGETIPANLTIRFSAHMVDRAAPTGYGLPTSTVHTSDPSNPLQVLNSIPTKTHYCPAPKQSNTCGQCRACWDSTVSNVSYHIH